MKCGILVFIFITMCSQLQAQHYVTLGIGASGMNNDSKDLDLFKETYNAVNGLSAEQGFQGFGWSLGIRPEAGYRYLGRWNAGIIAGYQNFIEHDFADFSNGESRKLELKMHSFFAELELGLPWKDFLFNGVASFYFNRKTSLKSEYSALVGETDEKSLSGTYTSPAATSFDLGFAAGYFKKPLMFMLKVMFPAFTGGESEILTDNAADKIAANIEKFPDDYLKYVQLQAYKGVASDVDGMKVILTLAYTISLKKQPASNVNIKK
jgi:hypothetical protein